MCDAARTQMAFNDVGRGTAQDCAATEQTGEDYGLISGTVLLRRRRSSQSV